MAPFLEHVFTFHRREDPHLQASFKSEDYVWSHSLIPRPECSRIQHCFNLVGVEHDADSPDEPFKYRQTAAYFSLDLVSAKTVWLIIKGNFIVRESIEEFSKKLDQPERLATTKGAFMFALQSHLLIYEWAMQSWTPYINHLGKKYSDISKLVKYVPVGKKTEDQVIDLVVKRKSTFTTGGQQNSGLHTSAAQTRKSHDRGPDISDIFSIDQLQRLHVVATEVQAGLSVLHQNKTVLQDMLKHFQYLHQSGNFRHSVEIEDQDFHTFLYRTEHCIGELESQHIRLTSMQMDIDRTTSLFNGILDYYNMRIEDSYARAAKASTDSMEQLTVKTKHETVSIHVITILTLFFLPATFVATFFGSGVIDLEHGEAQGKWGYWEVRWGALKLFGAVFGPLTGVVLAAWAFTYFKSAKEREEREVERYSA